ncbi:MAG: hypothetical protein U9R75_06755 [Candidatus Thermoplasmatota archaeon]|nr:hypothetical protein [Candidatus Thermoplasmatota archaeon]
MTGRGKRAIYISIGATVIILLLLIPIIMNISPSIDLGELDIEIRNDRCNISAKLLFSPDIETENEELDLALENATLPINFKKDRAAITLDENQFREIMDREKIRIVGGLDAKPLPFWRTFKKVDQNVDLSFISELVDSIEISNMELIPSPPRNMLLNFDLTADIEHDVTISIIDTRAKITASTSEHEVVIKELLISTDSVGYGSVEVRSSTLLALLQGEIEIDAWGITVRFDLPMDI